MSLTDDQIIDLLSVAAAYDNRKVNTDYVLAYGEASRRGRWTFQDAVDCVHEHYSRSTDFLMPAHITSLLREARSQPAPYRALEGGEDWQMAKPGEGPNPTGAPAAPEHIADVMAKLAANLGWALEIDRRSVLAVACPFCGELPGHACTRPTRKSGTGVIEMAKPHPSRIEAATAATTEENPDDD